MSNTSESFLSILIGEKLSSVEFVMDYLQLHFDGPTLTAITLPKVTVGQAVFEWGQPGYRDAICSFIAKKVVATGVVLGERISIRFAEDDNLEISLRPEDYSGAEAVMLTSRGNKMWNVW